MKKDRLGSGENSGTPSKRSLSHMAWIAKSGLIVTCALALFACEDEKTFTFNPEGFNGPLEVQMIPNTDLAAVISTNFDFANSISNPEADGGTINIIDTLTRNPLPSSATQIPNFGGRIAFESSGGFAFLADRDNDSVRIFKYSVPGDNGSAISFSLDSVIETGDDPFATFLIRPQGTEFTKLFTGNLGMGDLSLINVDQRTIVDLDPQDGGTESLLLNQLAIGSLDLSGTAVTPNRFTVLGNSGSDQEILLATTSSGGLLLAIDTKDNAIEAVYDLRSLSLAPRLHGIDITADKRAFIASHGIQGIVVLDLSGLTDNGVNNELLPLPFITNIVTGTQIEDVVISNDGRTLYAASFTRNSVLAYSTTNYQLIAEVIVEQGPVGLALTNSGDELYVTNFLNDSVSVLSTTTNTLITTIR